MKELTQEAIDTYIKYLMMIRIAYGSFVYKEHYDRTIRCAKSKYGQKQTEYLVKAIKEKIKERG